MIFFLYRFVEYTTNAIRCQVVPAAIVAQRFDDYITGHTICQAPVRSFVRIPDWSVIIAQTGINVKRGSDRRKTGIDIHHYIQQHRGADAGDLTRAGTS